MTTQPIRPINLTGRSLTLLPDDNARKPTTYKPSHRKRWPKVVESPSLEGPRGVPLAGIPNASGLPRKSSKATKVRRIYLVDPAVGIHIKGRPEIFYPANPDWVLEGIVTRLRQCV